MQLDRIPLLLILILLSGYACTPTREIAYDTSDIAPLSDSLHTDASISVMLFDDHRKDTDGATVLFESGRTSKIDGEKVCINAEKHYSTEQIPIQVATVLHSHLRSARAFKEVLFNTDTGQYQLNGDIVRLSGRQGFSNKAAVGAQFGLIGAIATSGIKTDGVIRITLANLRLTNTETGDTHQLEDIDLQFEGEYLIDAYCWNIYGHVNNKLKQTIDEKLLPSIVQAIKADKPSLTYDR